MIRHPRCDSVTLATGLQPVQFLAQPPQRAHRSSGWIGLLQVQLDRFDPLAAPSCSILEHAADLPQAVVTPNCRRSSGPVNGSQRNLKRTTSRVASRTDVGDNAIPERETCRPTALLRPQQRHQPGHGSASELVEGGCPAFDFVCNIDHQPVQFVERGV